MQLYIIFPTFVLLFTSVRSSALSTERHDGSFGEKTDHSPTQTKRDLSLSYTATNIDNKEGTRVKTITVIKNVGKSHEKLAINPDLHKNEEWATAFRDNFDNYGRIPDVPDIDDLFEFVNKKKTKGKDEEKVKVEGKPKAKEPSDVKPKAKEPSDVKPLEKPVVEASAEVKGASPEEDEENVEKIKGDAELIPSKKRHSNVRSQSISVDKYRVREPLIDVNYSSPHHSVHQYFQNYVAENSKGYDYPKPCPRAPATSVNVNTPNGRTYDIPVGNGSGGVMNPYIAPAIVKKTQVQPQTNSPNFPAAAANQPNYSVNSLLPPIQQSTPNLAGGNGNTTPQPTYQTFQQGGGNVGVSVSTSQRPYLAPNLRNGLGLSRGPFSAPQRPVYRSGRSNFRINAFGLNTNKKTVARSRGLKF